MICSLWPDGDLGTSLSLSLTVPHYFIRYATIWTHHHYFYHACPITLLLQWSNILLACSFFSGLKIRAYFLKSYPLCSSFPEIHPLKVWTTLLPTAKYYSAGSTENMHSTKVPIQPLLTYNPPPPSRRSWELKISSTLRKRVVWMAHCYILPVALSKGSQINFIIFHILLPSLLLLQSK